MKTNYLAKKLFSKKLFCILIGHQFTAIKKINNHFKELECSHCKIQVTNDNKGKITELTAELKDINKTLLYLHLKREFISHFYLSRNK